MEWMTSQEAQLIMSRTGMFPTNMKAIKALAINRNSFVYPYTDALDSFLVRPPVKNWSEIDNVYTKYLHEIFMEEVSVKEGLDRAAAEIDRLL